MKRLIALFGIILLVGVLVGGCRPTGPNRVDVKPKLPVEKKTVVNDEEGTSVNDFAEGAEKGLEEEEEERSEEGEETVEIGITQEDLDKLKKELENMKFEDLSGISE